MATSFTASGAIGLAPALAVMLGANVGTTLITQILAFNIAEVAPVLVLFASSCSVRPTTAGAEISAGSASGSG
jgi:phosphate:Na+ symporter